MRYFSSSRMLALFFSIVLSLIYSLTSSSPAMATGDSYTVEGPTTTYAQTSVATLISGIEIDQFASSSTTTIPVRLFVSSGSLSFGSTTGLSFSTASSGSLIEFTGILENINSALSTLSYTRGSVGSDTLEITLVDEGEVFFEENGHLYEFISGSLDWTAANTAASGLTRYGSTGYLATITSEEENNFVSERLVGDGWMGANDIASEGVWRWVAGPENGTQFWSGAAAGSAVNGNYENWSVGEPNNSGSNEDCAQFYVATGLWNDLPCVGFTLPGYVVEFGADGDMPSVASRNITINTINAPTVSTLSPADNATGIASDASLTITFSTVVTTSSGQLIIRQVSDNSTVETIMATSSLISGTGTDTIIINPSTTLSESTAYYITISSGFFTTTSSIPYAGISASTTWNFTIGDFTAPLITAVTSTAGQTTSTITWTTDELSSSLVYYGATLSYTASTTESDTSPRVTSHSVDLSSLLPCATYFYMVMSQDASSNTATSTATTDRFTTLGCTGTTTPSGVTSTGFDVSSGGSTEISIDSGANLEVTIPTNLTTTSDSIVIQIHALPRTQAYTTIGLPTDPDSPVGAIAFDVKAIINGTTELDSFDAPVTITYTYTDEEISGLDEATISIYHYSNSTWTELEDCSVNISNNTVSCTTESFSIFGIFGDLLPETAAASPSTSGSGRSFVPPEAPRSLGQPESSMIINEGAPTTDNRIINIRFAVENTDMVALSENSNFSDTGFLPFSTNMIFTLSNSTGPKTIYARLRSSQGGTLDLMDSITLTERSHEEDRNPQTTQIVSKNASLQCGDKIFLTKSIRLGAANHKDDVRLLEEFLNTYENSDLPENGIYEKNDFDAVVRWQEKHAKDILAPWGIKNGTGYVFTTSLAKIKAIHEAHCQSNKKIQTATILTNCQKIFSNLSKGNSGQEVSMIQAFLKNHGYTDFDPTGYYGPLTEKAVIKFQKDHDLAQVGMIGPKTRNKINDLNCRP